MFGKIRDAYRQAYSGLPGRAWILFTVNLVNASGTMVFFFLSLYLTRKAGFTPAQAGRALSLYGVGMVAGNYLGGWLADRAGSIAVQKASLTGCGVLLVVLGQVRPTWAILSLLFLLASAAGMLYPANATSMSHVCPAELRVKGFALNRLANNLGATIGPAVGGVLALRDYRLIFWGDGLTSLLAAGVFVLLWKGTGFVPPVEAVPGPSAAAAPDVPPKGAQAPDDQPKASHSEASGVAGPDRSPWRDGPFLLLVVLYFLWSSIFIQLLTTFPLYMRGVYGLAENRIGQLFAVNTVMIVVLEMILMEKIRRFPLTRMINLSFLLLGAGLGLLPFGRGFAFGALTVAVWTFGEMLGMPLYTALIAGRAGEASRGRYLGLSSLAFSLAFIAAPAAGTAVYGRFGGATLWFGCAALSLLLAAAFSLLRPHLEEVQDGAGSTPT
jgi:predicted MFS family arabinose efflux permease